MDRWLALTEAVNEDRLLNTLMEMVAIPSPSGEEGKIGRFIAEKARAWGLDVEVKPVIDDRVNVHVALSGQEPGPTFLFNGHLDTEPLAPGWTLSPFEPFVKDGYLYGSDASNMKAANSAMLEALLVLREKGALKKGKVIITLVAGECDKLGIGTQHTINDGVRADAALVGEPKDLQVLTAHSSVLQAKVTTHGIPVHVKSRELGVCAIQKMIKIIGALNDDILTYTPQPDVPVAPRINVGWIKGGALPSSTAPSCEAIAEVRGTPGMSVEGVIKDVERVIEELQKDDPEIKASVTEHSALPFGPRVPLSTPRDERVVQVTREASQAVTGEEPRAAAPSSYYGWSDAPILQQAGIPTVVCGPLTGDQVNKPDQKIEFAKVVQAAKVYTLVAAEMTQGGDRD